MTPSPHSLVEDVTMEVATTSAQEKAHGRPVTAADLETDSAPLWIFGYGSLMWRAGFDFDASAPAFIDGYTRHFSQGNIGCRGNEQMPARVATIERDESPDAHTPGLLLRATDRHQALAHLHEREIETGYQYITVVARLAHSGEQVTAITCISHGRHLYFGRLHDERLPAAALQIAMAVGPTGLENAEYVLKCAHYTRKLFPDFDDRPLFRLERLVVWFRETLDMKPYDF